jgi:hypothetical protein
MGVASVFGVLLALPAACSGDSFSADSAGGGGNASGGSKGGSGGKSGGQGGSTSQSGSPGEGGEGLEPGTGGSVVSTGGEGGEPGTGGSAGTGGSGMTDGGVACGFGSIQFEMRPGPNVTPGYFCTAAPCVPWVTIYSHVEQRWLTLANNCQANDCSTCMFPVCVDPVCMIAAVPSDGVKMTWDGTNYASNLCMNLGIDVMCLEPVCLPHGSYEARMCADVNEASTPEMCQTGGNQVCRDVDFEFTGGDLVVTAEVAPG